jgi:hypothetical protein
VFVVVRQLRLGYLELGSLFRPAAGVADLGGSVGIPAAVGVVAAFAGFVAAFAGIPAAVGLVAASVGLVAASVGLVAASVPEVDGSDIQEAMGPVVVRAAYIEPVVVGHGNFVGGLAWGCLP